MFKIGGHISTFEDITCGIPQGSCLEPFPLLVYSNDLHISLNRSEVHIYVDDNSITFSSESIPDINKKVNSGLLFLKPWMESNKLSINFTKTQTTIIDGRKRLKDIENYDPQNLQAVIG